MNKALIQILQSLEGFSPTVLAIAAIIIFAPEAIPLIPGWLSRLGYIGG